MNFLQSEFYQGQFETSIPCMLHGVNFNVPLPYSYVFTLYSGYNVSVLYQKDNSVSLYSFVSIICWNKIFSSTLYSKFNPAKS